jgi:ABC-type uncharacterized transport system permease subunit
MLLKALIHSSVALHAVATGFFLAYLFRFRETVGRAARLTLWVAAGASAAALIGHAAAEGAGGMPAVHCALFTAALVIDLAYLLAARRFELTLLGSFVVPVSTAMLLSILFVRAAGRPEGLPLVGAVTWMHIVASALAFLIFTAAFLASAGYLVKDFGLRTKRPLPLADRLPSLSRLGRMAHRHVLLGFPVYTVGLLLGTIWLGRAGAGAMLQPQILLALASWLAYGLLLQMNATSGWRGTRAAILGMVGYLLVLTSVMIYALRHLPGA